MDDTIPTPKKSLILFNKFKSFLFKLIKNRQTVRQPDLYFLSLMMVNIKLPSPSINPVTYQGFSVDFNLE